MHRVRPERLLSDPALQSVEPCPVKTRAGRDALGSGPFDIEVVENGI
jgi:hypothetical protein